MSANERQVGGDHYAKHGALQHWDVVAHFNLDYYQGCVSKYLFRWRDKGGLQDLLKARHYLDKYIELEQAKLAPETAAAPDPTVNRDRDGWPWDAPTETNGDAPRRHSCANDLDDCRTCEAEFHHPEDHPC